MARMEPTDESDGFVNITPDPGAPVEVSVLRVVSSVVCVVLIKA